MKPTPLLTQYIQSVENAADCSSRRAMPFGAAARSLHHLRASLRCSNKFGLFVFICWGWAGASPAPTLRVYKTLIIIFLCI